MSQGRFVTGTCFQWQDAFYEVTEVLPDRQVNIVNLDTGVVKTVPYTELIKGLFVNRDLQFVITGKAAKSTSNGTPSTEYEYLDLDDCEPHLVQIAKWRLSVIQPLLDMPAEERTRAHVSARVDEVRTSLAGTDARSLGTSVSVASVYQWIKDYTGSGKDLRSLVPLTRKRGGVEVHRVTSDIDATVTKVIQKQYYRRERISLDDMHQLVAAELDKEDEHLAEDQRRTPPSRQTVFRRIQELDMRDVLLAKRGRRAARKDLQQFEKTNYPKLPLQRVEIDHTRTDLLVIDDLDNLPLGRLTLTYCLDLATRYPLGYYLGFEPPSYYAVAECIYHAICPKEDVKERYETEHDWLAHGLFSTLVVDNGRELIGKDLRDVAMLLGFTIEICPVRTPEFKAGVERALRTFAHSFFHTLPGTTFSNPQQRGDYDSAKQACVYLSDIDRLLHLYIVDQYAERYHKGLEGVPARAWERHLQNNFLPLLPASLNELSILLGQVETRCVWHYGIEWDNLRYNCPELADIRTFVKDQPVKVKRNPGDLSRIHVYNPLTQQYLEVPVIPQAQEYTDHLSLWKHRVVCEWARATGDKVDLAALGRAKLKIQAIVDASRARKRIGTRTKMARWETAGKPSRDLTPAPALPAPEPALPSNTPAPESGSRPALPVEKNPFSLPAEGWEIAPMPQTLNKSKEGIS